MNEFLYQASIYLAAAVIAVPLSARLGLGSVLGYLAAGIAIGPVLGLVGAETESLQHVAEFGVVMMLFLIGLELEPRALWDMRDKLLGLGGLQIALSTAAIAAVAVLCRPPMVGVTGRGADAFAFLDRNRAANLIRERVDADQWRGGQPFRCC